jgi:hypothetical protein
VTCSIAIERHRSLRIPASGPRLYSYNLIVVRSKNHYFLAPTSDLAGLLVFSSDGSFSHRIGERGEEPGKFRNIESLAVGPGDSLYVFDVRDMHLTVLSPTGTIARRVPVPNRIRSVVSLGASRFVAHMVLNTPNEFGLPLHHLDGQGRVHRSFGTVDQAVPLGGEHRLYRVIGRATDSTVWSSRLDSVALEEWTISGRRIRRVEGELFRLAMRHGVTTYTKQDPGPRLRHIWRSDDGFLWVLMTFPTAFERSHQGSVGQSNHSPRSDAHKPTPHALATLIVAVDSRTGRVLASRVHEDVMEGISSDGYAFSRTASSDAIQLWRLRLRPNLGERREK